jgi:two-component system chemotaxis sensor kinase CheA
MDDVIREFIVESSENLQRMEQELVLLEREPDNAEIIADIFRTVHTIKGTCGFFDFFGLEELGHAGENLLSRLRDREVAVDSEITDALLALVDGLRKFLANIEADGTEGVVDTAELIGRLSELCDADGQASSKATQKKRGASRRTRKTSTARSRAEPSAADEGSESKSPPRSEAPAEEPIVLGEVAEADPAEQQLGITTTSVRLDVGLLDNMMSMVGELVLIRNQIVELVAESNNGQIAPVSQRLNMVTSRLQEAVMRTRMQSIDTVFSALPRLARDIAVAGGKRIEMQVEGSDTELDRTIIEAIKDPMIHLVRNAVDHGVERPAARRKAKKTEEGRIALAATHENGQVIISIADDGAGIDAESVRQRALELSLAEPELLRRTSDSDVLQLVFSPGFSTATEVTNVSGRGVGLDVVRNNIERIGGSIDLQSAPKRGTTVRIRLPMTLAIIQALMVRSRGHRFAIPQLSTMELVRLEGDGVGRGIEYMHGAPVYRLRGKLLPVVELGAELGLGEPQTTEDERAVSIGNRTIVVLRANERDFGLVVDGVNETQEIVVKPLGHLLRRIRILAGTTILGDGRVALILDVPALAQRSHIISEGAETTLKAVDDKEPERARERQPLLLFATPDDGRMAIPLNSVAHLDTIDLSAVERAGSQELTQYRGEILPLIHIDASLEERRREPRRSSPVDLPESLHVVVYSSNDRKVGLVVDQIIDIVEIEIDLQRPGTRPYVLGTMVIRDRVTEILDVDRLVADADPGLLGELPEASGE